MKIEVRYSINGGPAGWYEARGVYNQSDAEDQCRRVLGPQCQTLGIRTSSEDVPEKKGWFW